MLSGCEALAQRPAWDQVDRVRSRLVGIGNLHAFGLAAYAAFRVDDHGACLNILKDCAETCVAGQLPRSLVFLRSRANEALGRHGDSILDLLAARLAGDTGDVDLRLLETYQKIGALSEFRDEAERALASDRLDPRQALRVAHVLRGAAPDTARRALAKATREGVSPEIAGAVMNLASRLGLGHLQDDAVRLLMLPAGAALAIRKFEGVESLMAFMEENSREYRERIEGWLQGRIPAAIAFLSDPKDFAYLFLADAKGRRNRLGDPLPMLLRAGGLAGREITVTEERPTIRMDLSALLLAAGLGILPTVARAFQVQVPRSAPEALVELEAELPQVDLVLVRRCSDLLGDALGSLEIVEAAPPGSLALEAADEVGALDTPVLGDLLLLAFMDGHVDRPTAEDVLGAPLPVVTGRTSVGTVMVTPAVLAKLVASETLDVISRITRPCITVADAERCRRDLAAARQAHDVKRIVSDLRSTLAEGLKGSWTTVSATSADIANQGEGPPKPAHLRCLMEVIAAQEHAPTTCWIEDRTLSRSGFVGVVDVLDVVDHIHRAGVIDTAERKAIRRRLRDKGYSYVAPDEAEVLDVVLSAPVDEGGLVQTPALTALRACMAGEFAKAVHLDQTAYLAEPGGAPQGEIRHLLALDGLARQTLAGVWSAPSKSRAVKLACSEWAWTYLRAGNAPGWPNDVEPGRRRQYLAMTVAHTLDLALLDSLSPGGMSPGDRRSLVDWFDAAQIRPMVRADAGALAAVADILAPTLASFLDHDPPDEVDSPLRERYALFREALVREFFDLMPDDLAQEIGQRHGLADRLDAKPMMAVTFGQGKEISLERLAAAYAACLASTDPSLPVPLTLADGASATLRIPDASAGNAIINAGEVSTELAASTCVLLGADAEVRRSALRSSGELTDPRGLLRERDLDTIAGVEPLMERIATFEQARASDYHHRMTRLGRLLRGSVSIAMSEFAIPSPDAMLAYMRLSSIEDGTLAGAIAAAATELAAELGLQEAVRRFSGVPVDLPAEMASDFARAVPGPTVEAGPPAAVSPMQALFRLRGLLTAADAGDEVISAAVQGLVTALDVAGPVFATLVRAGFSRVIADPLWSGIPPLAKVCMVWMHADHVVDVLLGANVDCGRFAVMLDDATRPDFHGVEERRAMQPWVRRVTTDLSAQLLDALLATHVVSDAVPARLPVDMQATLKALCGTEGKLGISPGLDMVAPAPPGPDYLWIGRDLVTQWLTVGWTSAEHPFAERDPTALARRMVALDADPAHPYMLAVLIGAINPHGIEPEVLPAVRDAMIAAKGEAALEPEYAGMFRVLSAYAVVLGRQEDGTAMDEILGQQAARCRAKWPRARIRHRDADTDADKAFSVLMAGAFEYAMALPQSRAERIEAYGKAAARIAAAWPGSQEGIISKLDDLIRQASASDAAGLWKVLLTLRGTGSSSGSRYSRLVPASSVPHCPGSGQAQTGASSTCTLGAMRSRLDRHVHSSISATPASPLRVVREAQSPRTESLSQSTDSE